MADKHDVNERATKLRVLAIRFNAVRLATLFLGFIGTVAFAYVQVSAAKDAPQMLYAFVATFFVLCGWLLAAWLWEALSVGLQAGADLLDRTYKLDRD